MDIYIQMNIDQLCFCFSDGTVKIIRKLNIIQEKENLCKLGDLSSDQIKFGHISGI